MPPSAPPRTRRHTVPAPPPPPLALSHFIPPRFFTQLEEHMHVPIIRGRLSRHLSDRETAPSPRQTERQCDDGGASADAAGGTGAELRGGGGGGTGWTDREDGEADGGEGTGRSAGKLSVWSTGSGKGVEVSGDQSGDEGVVRQGGRGWFRRANSDRRDMMEDGKGDGEEDDEQNDDDEDEEDDEDERTPTPSSSPSPQPHDDTAVLELAARRAAPGLGKVVVLDLCLCEPCEEVDVA